MELRELESFVILAEELHFGRAARRAHVSQPALTQRIQRLERELGAQLLTRDRRGVALTPAGVVLFQRGRRVLADADAMTTSVQRVASGRGGVLRVGYVASALYGPIPPILRWLRANTPEVELALEEHKTAQQLDLLERGALDAGFVHPPDTPPAGYQIVELGHEKQVVALPRDHALAASRRVAFADLATEPIVLFPRVADPDGYDRVVAACAAQGFAPAIGQEAPNLQAMLGLVAGGLGVAFVSRAAASALNPRHVVFRPLAPPLLELTNAVMWREDLENPAITSLQKAIDALAE